MTPSQRALRLEQELDALATLAERTADVQRKALAAGIAAVKLGPDTLEAVGKRIRNLLSDIDLHAMAPASAIGERCPECGEILTGA